MNAMRVYCRIYMEHGKKNHHSSRIIQFVFYFGLFLENIEVCAKAHGQQVKYGPAGGRGHLCITLRLRPPRLRLGGSAPSGFRSKMASSSSTSTSTTSSTSSAVPRALISRDWKVDYRGSELLF